MMQTPLYRDVIRKTQNLIVWGELAYSLEYQSIEEADKLRKDIQDAYSFVTTNYRYLIMPDTEEGLEEEYNKLHMLQNYYKDIYKNNKKEGEWNKRYLKKEVEKMSDEYLDLGWDILAESSYKKWSKYVGDDLMNGIISSYKYLVTYFTNRKKYVNKKIEVLLDSKQPKTPVIFYTVEETNEECGVCLEENPRMHKLNSCGHKLCYECLGKICGFRVGVDKREPTCSCPFCRTRMVALV